MADTDKTHQRLLGPVVGRFDGVLTALKRLDRVLESAVAAGPAPCGTGEAALSMRGLYLSQKEVETLLTRQPGESAFPVTHQQPAESLSDSSVEDSHLGRLKQLFGLSPFDLDLLLIALAPEVDLRYERLYAYLQDDVTRKRPTVELALNLLCPSTEAKLKALAHLAPTAPLIGQSLVHLFPDPTQNHEPFLAHYLKADEQVVRWLLGPEGLDGSLALFCEMIVPAPEQEELGCRAEVWQAITSLAVQACESRRPLRLFFLGPHGAGKKRLAEALAYKLARPLLAGNLLRAPEAKAELEQALKLLFREARLQDAILYIGGLEALRADGRAHQYDSLVAVLAEAPGITLLGDTQPCSPAMTGRAGAIVVPCPIPDFAARQACWQTRLAREGMTLDGVQLEALAGRFRLTPGQIAGAVTTARTRALWRAATHSLQKRSSPSCDQPTLDDLFAAARTQSGLHLKALTRKIEPRYIWGDLVLPQDQLAQLKEICIQAHYRHVVYGEWGFDRKLSLGRGLNALFSGPPGTGKTMAAEVLAHELGLDLYKIDLSQVVSKYIGETEKNLAHIFAAAENSNAILFFDEADALFGKRSEVKDAHDRYANIEIAYLLQKMEEYEGLAILATNLRQHLDEAFVRRMHVIVEFPFPDEEYRRRIWEAVFPQECPLGEEVDFTLLARQVRLAGGNIKNIALAAAFYAADDGRVIRRPHLLRAAQREYQKLGRAWSETEWTLKEQLRPN